MTGPTRRAPAALPRVRESQAAVAVEPTQGHTCGDPEHEGDSDRSVCAVLDAAGVGAILGIGRSSVYELDAREALPEPIQLGSRRRWVKAEIEAWLVHGAPKRGAWARTWPRVRKEVLRR